MSTRSLIGMKTGNEVSYIYCHNDGYPEYVGLNLLAHYSKREKVEQLMELGDLSTIGKEIGVKVDFDEFDNFGNQCLAYGRDRGEQNVDARTCNWNEFADKDNIGTEYVYIFGDDNQWFYFRTNGDKVLSESIFNEYSKWVSKYEENE